MDKCCRTCKWFRNEECHNDDMTLKHEFLEDVIGDILMKMKMDAKESYLRDVVRGFEEVILSRVEDVNFVPNDHSGFYCKYYE